MLIEIRHKTIYSYAVPARYSAQRLRITPPSFDGQHVKSWSIEAPGFANAVRFRDAYGNTTHLATLNTEHDGLTVNVSGLVETEDRCGIVRGLAEVAPCHVYLRKTLLTEPCNAIETLAQKTLGKYETTDMLNGMHALMNEIREVIEYKTGETDAHTSAQDALREGKGVCQDHAHVFIAAARCRKIPARYVNGYFLSGANSPSDAHHAWAEAWIDGLGWTGFDPANGLCPTERYVRLTWGLDADSAAPIRGTQRGGTNEQLDVVVEVNALESMQESQQQQGQQVQTQRQWT